MRPASPFQWVGNLAGSGSRPTHRRESFRRSAACSCCMKLMTFGGDVALRYCPAFDRKDRGDGMEVLRTERLRLRWFGLADAPFMLGLLNEPAWIQHIYDP